MHWRCCGCFPCMRTKLLKCQASSQMWVVSDSGLSTTGDCEHTNISKRFLMPQKQKAQSMTIIGRVLIKHIIVSPHQSLFSFLHQIHFCGSAVVSYHIKAYENAMHAVSDYRRWFKRLEEPRQSLISIGITVSYDAVCLQHKSSPCPDEVALGKTVVGFEQGQSSWSSQGCKVLCS